MIKIDKASLNFGSQTVFNEISLAIKTDQKIGLIGPNGAGKSTLLKILAKHQQFDSGKVSVSGNTTIAYLPQEITLNSKKTTLAECLTVFKDFKAWESVQSLEAQLKTDPNNHELLEQYAHDIAQLHEHDFERTVAQTKSILMGLGFKEEQFEKPVNTFSVGWRMRISLAKLLLQKASFYLFDEPTNHLDIVAKTWFINFLKNAQFGFMLVCHDKYFLEKTCNQIIEVAQGRATAYNGNYSECLVQKQENEERLQSAYLQQQKEIAQKRATAERFRYKSSKAKMAQNLFRQIDKIELIEPPSSLKKINIKLKTPPNSGTTVLTVKNVAHAFEDKPIFKNVSFEVERGQKVAIIAPNGTGKTTLFNLICEKYPLQAGSIKLGHNVIPTIFEQDQNIALDHNKTIFDEVNDNCPNITEQEIRSMLGAFLFSNKDVYKPIKVLSGGEKNRVSMVKVLLSSSNLLLLDEPTNHLDIQSKEILLDTLQKYQGTILFVSHDHDFVNHLATHTVFLKPDSAYLYEGSYEDYLDQNETTSGNNNKTKSNKNAYSPEISHEDRKEIRKLERTINKLEKDITKIENDFDGLLYGTFEFDKQTDKLNAAKEKLSEAMNKWEKLN